MKLATFFISFTTPVFTKLSRVSQSSIEIKVRPHWTLFIILITLAVICKQRLMRGNEIVQYLQNYQCYNIDQDHFRKSL